MNTSRKQNSKDSVVMFGKMALPNQYFAGQVGSKFIISLRDANKIDPSYLFSDNWLCV